MTSDILPDDVLLEIFNFYVDEDIDGDFDPFNEQRIDEWITLAHVCRRWRSIVFQSPNRLNLRVYCTPKTPVRDTLDIWPPLPLIICDADDILDDEPSRVDNIIAALEHHGRMCQIDLVCLTSSQLEYVANSSAMQKPFPELTDLRLKTYYGPGPILPDSFLGGTAPRLRSLDLFSVPFPGLLKLLSSAIHLVSLDLRNVPRSGYIPPEAMAASFSALTSLKSLRLEFRYPPRPRPTPQSRLLLPLPLTRSILPRLTEIRFKGGSEYLEEILAQLDAPRLNKLHITFFNQIIFDMPQLSQFVSRSSTLRTSEKGYIRFGSKAIIVKFPSQTSNYDVLSLEILCTASDWQLSSIEQVCTSSCPPISTLEDLYIFGDRRYPPHWQDDVKNTLWLDLLRPFVAVKNLYLPIELALRIAPALQELVGGRTTEVLPTLENIFLEVWNPPHEGIKMFVAARRLTTHPVAISHWNRNSELDTLGDLYF